jgi:pilus assembly protein CpaC
MSSILRDVMRGAAVALSLALVMATTGRAADEEAHEKLRVAVGHLQVVQSPEEVRTVAIADPDIADAAVGSARTVLLTAKAPGSTNLVVYNAAGKYKVYDVEVYLYNAKKQVLLHCTVAEVNDGALQELGVDWLGSGTTNNNPIDGFLGGGVFNAKNLTGDQGILDHNEPVLFDQGTDMVLRYIRNDGGLAFAAAIKALESEGAIKLLANPSLLATSGEQASFLSGGEFAYQTVLGTGLGAMANIEFKEFGVKLEFTPFVQEDGSIRLKVAPEISEPDYTRSVMGVPPLNTRRASTLVTLNPGEYLAIGGLKDTRSVKVSRKIPLLGYIPVLGFFFSYTRDETTIKDLLVVVTPELVEPSTVRPALPVGVRELEGRTQAKPDGKAGGK